MYYGLFNGMVEGSATGRGGVENSDFASWPADQLSPA